MKKNDKDKSISTIPKGVWESNSPEKNDNSGKSSPSTDLQGNGYPTKQSN